LLSLVGTSTWTVALRSPFEPPERAGMPFSRIRHPPFPRLRSVSRLLKRPQPQSKFLAFELRSDRAVFFMDHVYRRGTYKLTYLARCTVRRRCQRPTRQGRVHV
jgi:hypothetical protein